MELKKETVKELRVWRDRDRELKSRYTGDSGYKVIEIWSGKVSVKELRVWKDLEREINKGSVNEFRVWRDKDRELKSRLNGN
jgi:hypothetical protein